MAENAVSLWEPTTSDVVLRMNISRSIDLMYPSANRLVDYTI